MKKIILIEDRLKRQELFLGSNGGSITELSQLVENAIGDKAKEYLNKIENSDYSFLNNCKLLMCHRSALTKRRILSNILSHCKEVQLPLILFTGGEGQISYLTEPIEYLILSSRVFYSELLFNFLELYQKEEDTRLIQFPYKEKWELIYLLKLRNLAWQHGDLINVPKPLMGEIIEVIGEYNSLGDINNKINQLSRN